MDADRLRVLLAAPLASLFLVLSLCAFVVQRPISAGIEIPIVRIHRDPNRNYTCDGRPLFMRLTKDGKSWINETEIPPNQIGPTVSIVMENRAKRVVYVVVDSELSYGQFVSFMNRMNSATPNLHLILISGAIRREFEASRNEFSKAFAKGQFANIEPLDTCDFEISENTYKRWSAGESDPAILTH
jgi:biopolymer transport protein ExbD